MKYIIGSGFISFLAKCILPEYRIIPIGKSRYYQYEVSTCDDYIFCHDEIEDFIKEHSFSFGQIIPVFFKRALSYSGQIMFNKNEGFFDSWLSKVYGSSAHPAANKLIKFDSFVYNIACVDLFKNVEKKCKPDFRDFILDQNKIKHVDINNRIIHTNKGQLEYESIINTIPLDSMFNLCGIEHDLESRDLHTFVIETADLDFEGASELLVVDNNIDFFKCTRIGKQVYQFFSIEEIANLPKYLDLFVSKYDILSATVVRNAIPLSDHNKHKELEQYGIMSVGSNAQWDDMMDVSSCIRRLIRMSKDGI